jgi:lysophospholipase L1-like esterase
VLVKDGLHPTQAGHEVIFQKVKTEIDSLLNSLDS